MPSNRESRLGTALGTRESLIASQAVTGDGVLYDNTRWGDVSVARVQLNLTALTYDAAAVGAVAPTFTVVLEDTLDDGATWNTIGAFAARTAIGREVINITTPFSDRVRVRHTLTGTSPSATFAVDAYTE